MTANAWNKTVTYEVDGISSPRILRDTRVGVVDAVIFFEYNIFQNSTKPQSCEDVRLRFTRQIDRLRVASALDVEDSIVTPAMFIVADQIAFGICRQRGFPCTT